MTAPLHILVAIDELAAGVAQVRQVAPDATLALVPPFPPGTSLPAGQIRDCQVLFSSFTPANFADMPALRWIQLGSAGYNQLQGLPLHTQGVQVTNASGVNDVPIAEWCVAMMLMFQRDLPALLALQRERVWDPRPRFQSELRGHRVGILGYGNIGREVARLCHSLGLEVWAMGRGPIGPRPLRYGVPGSGDPEGQLPQRTFTVAQMADFLPHLDYLILTAPLTPQTAGLLGERELRLLPRHAVLLNPSRGPLVDEAALLRALQEGWFAGAALDAHHHYPLPADHPLWSLPNVIVSPHISGSVGSPHYLSRLWDLFAQNLGRFLAQEPLLNEVHLEP